MLLPPPDELEVFLRAASPHNPGIGILDTRSGQLHLMAASMLADGDHASLAELVLGFVDIDQAAHLRGFVVGIDANSWRIVNNSGLNPVGNRMESELFDELLTTLLPLLKRPTL